LAGNCSRWNPGLIVFYKQARMLASRLFRMQPKRVEGRFAAPGNIAVQAGESIIEHEKPHKEFYPGIIHIHRIIAVALRAPRFPRQKRQ